MVSFFLFGFLYGRITLHAAQRCWLPAHRCPICPLHVRVSVLFNQSKRLRFLLSSFSLDGSNPLSRPWRGRCCPKGSSDSIPRIIDRLGFQRPPYWTGWVENGKPSPCAFSFSLFLFGFSIYVSLSTILFGRALKVLSRWPTSGWESSREIPADANWATNVDTPWRAANGRRLNRKKLNFSSDWFVSPSIRDYRSGQRSGWGLGFLHQIFGPERREGDARAAQRQLLIYWARLVRGETVPPLVLIFIVKRERHNIVCCLDIRGKNPCSSRKKRKERRRARFSFDPV